MSADPIGQAGGINVFGYAASNPVVRADPLGLDLVVIEGGPVPGNPFGHTAVGIEARGVFSKGTEEDLGSPTSDYVQSQSEHRDQELTFIETTPEQDSACEEAFRKVADEEYDWNSSNCTNAVNACLDAAGVPTGWSPDALPGSAGRRAKDYSADQNEGNPTTIRIPKGGRVRTAPLSRF